MIQACVIIGYPSGALGTTRCVPQKNGLSPLYYYLYCAFLLFFSVLILHYFFFFSFLFLFLFLFFSSSSTSSSLLLILISWPHAWSITHISKIWRHTPSMCSKKVSKSRQPFLIMTVGLFLCGLHVVCSYIITQSDLFIHLSKRVEHLSRGGLSWTTHVRIVDLFSAHFTTILQNAK